MIVLSGVVYDGTIALVENLEEQTQIVMAKERDYDLIKKNFHFVMWGARPYSSELSSVFLDNIIIGNYVKKILGNNEYLVYPDHLVNYGRREAVFIDDIRDEQIDFLRDLGKRIEVKNRYSLVQKA